MAGAGALLIALVVGGVVIAQSLLVGGAATPKEAVDKLVQSVSAKDVLGAYAVIAPRERDALQRVESTFVKKFGELRIADAIKTTTTQVASAGGILDGLAISISGTHPRTENLSPDLAAVVVDTGEVKWSVDPSGVTGLTSAQIGAIGAKQKLSGSARFASLEGGRGLTLMVVKSDGRWYVSLLLSGLDYANDGAARGALPSIAPKGSASPQAAAEAAVRAASHVSKDGIKALAPYLEGEEAQAIYLYGAAAPWASDLARSLQVTVGDAAFTAGPQDQERAIAFVEHLTFSPGRDLGGEVTLSSKCVTEGKKQKICLNGSGYFGPSPVKGILSTLSDDGKFALTAVKEDKSWKVSLLDTAADHAVAWMDSLTRDQWLATLGLQHSDKAVGNLVLGKETTVKFNSAGYSVMMLTVPARMRLVTDDDVSGVVYDAAGREVAELRPEYASRQELGAGRYKVVLTAGSRWVTAFSDQGDALHYSTALKVDKFSIRPPTINGDVNPTAGAVYAYVEGSGETFNVQVPDGNNVDLVLTVTDAIGNGVGSGLIAVVDDDNEGLGVAATAGAQVTIPLPADPAAHNVTVYLPPSSGNGHIDFSLAFVPQQGLERPADYVISSVPAM